MSFSPKSASETTPPKTEAELLERAHRLAGRKLATLAQAIGEPVPQDFRRNKGWVGRLLETALGATASSRPMPDFEELAIELKTLPVTSKGEPKETTYVCSVRLPELQYTSWEKSLLKKKLQRVLWVPIEADPTIPIPGRRVGTPLLWSPSPEEERRLRNDWEDFAQLIGDGYVNVLTGERGQYLQVRPKAAHSRVRRWGHDHEGAPMLAHPRGFYLRRNFTLSLLQKHFVLPPQDSS